VSGLHRFDPAVAERALAWVTDRIERGAPLGSTASRQELDDALATPSVTRAGLGLDEAWRRFADVVAPATVGLNHPRFLAFIPAAPSPSAVLMDAMVSAASFSAESWLEAAGAVHAENEVLSFLAELAGLPADAGGCFVSGGSAGNLSALAVARDHRPGRPAIAAASTAHASVANTARLLGCPLVDVPVDERGRLTGPELAVVLARHPEVGAVVASAGTTNAGTVDDLRGVADACSPTATWLHVDAAYGGAALLVPEARHRFDGIDLADSLIIDPHKWLFAPLGSCALLYRDPRLARTVHAQEASYLDAIRADDAWNPADYGYQLTRRAAGLALWFALAVHGVEAHAAAVRRGIDLAQAAARLVDQLGAPLELVMEPELSVVLFRRTGWTDDDWRDWSRDLLARGIAFVTPTRWRGETVGRLVFLHPDTPDTVAAEVLASAHSSERGA